MGNNDKEQVGASGAAADLLVEARAVFDLMLEGCSLQCFGDYQNGHGETIGPRMDALHAKLRALPAASGGSVAALEGLTLWDWSEDGMYVDNAFDHYIIKEDGERLLAAAGSASPAAAGGTAEQQARYAIDGAIQYGRENRIPPPSTDHWLYEYWNIGRQLAKLGETGWDNITPLEREALAHAGVGAQRNDAQVPGIDYPTTYADLARISPVQLWNRWYPRHRSVTPREAFIAAREIPFAAPSSDVAPNAGNRKLTPEQIEDAQRIINDLCALDAAKKPGSGVHGQVIGCEPWVIRSNGYGIACLHDAAAFIKGAIESELANAAPEELPAVLFDSKAVYDEVMAVVRCKSRTSPENVSDTLDAVVRLMRREGVAPAGAVPEGYVLALQTAVDMPDGKKELGYTLLDGIGIFTSQQEVSDAIAELSLPLGWVSMTTSQLLPGWMLPAAPVPPAAAPADSDEAVTLLAAVFDAWENGDPCYEEPENFTGYLGMAFRLDDDVFKRCCDLLNRKNPPRNAAPADQVRDAALGLSGHMTDIGQLGGVGSENGVVIERDEGSITITGLTASEVRALAPVAFEDISIEIRAIRTSAATGEKGGDHA